MATVAILGGGISGLSCAYYLKTLGKANIKYLFLLDKSPKFGGWIQTTRYPDGAIFEHGPRTLRFGTKAGYNALALADELGLASRILPIGKDHPAKTNFLLVNNNLCPLPRDSKSLIWRTKPFSRPLIFYVLKEIFTKKATIEDESVYSFIERRAGKELAKYVIDAMCRGISAGDARELSIRSLFPTMYEAEAKHGSVLKGILNESVNVNAKEFESSSLINSAVHEKWRMWTLKSGLTELIDALACSVENKGVSDLIFDAKCTGLNFKGDGVEVVVDNENIKVDHVFSSIPSQELAPLLASYPVLSENLKSISSVDMAVVYLEYKENILKHSGFGFLVPSVEHSNILGTVFDSCCFPELNGTNKTRLTCMIGGRWFNKVLGDPDSVSDDKILQLAINGVSAHLGIQEKPVRSKVTLQRNCIPQYVVGHYKKLEKIHEEIENHKLNISLIGASYKGAGVPDCIQNAKISVENFLKSI